MDFKFPALSVNPDVAKLPPEDRERHWLQISKLQAHAYQEEAKKLEAKYLTQLDSVKQRLKQREEAVMKLRAQVFRIKISRKSRERTEKIFRLLIFRRKYPRLIHKQSRS